MPWVTFVMDWMRGWKEENSGDFGRVSRNARNALKRQADGSAAREGPKFRHEAEG